MCHVSVIVCILRGERGAAAVTSLHCVQCSSVLGPTVRVWSTSLKLTEWSKVQKNSTRYPIYCSWHTIFSSSSLDSEHCEQTAAGWTEVRWGGTVPGGARLPAALICPAGESVRCWMLILACLSLAHISLYHLWLLVSQQQLLRPVMWPCQGFNWKSIYLDTITFHSH